MATDFEQIFDVLGNAQARFVVVGGVAVVLQGHPRLTADLDLVVQLEPDNARKAMEALETLGYRPRAPVRAVDFADPEQRRVWSPTIPATEVDVFVSEPVPFAELAGRATRLRIGTTEVLIASIQDLVDMKAKVGRGKDLEDVRELQKLQAMRKD
jgi:predicted nucleotidyltransferase